MKRIRFLKKINLKMCFNIQIVFINFNLQINRSKFHETFSEP